MAYLTEAENKYILWLNSLILQDNFGSNRGKYKLFAVFYKFETYVIRVKLTILTFCFVY